MPSIDEKTIKLILDMGQAGKSAADVRTELERLKTAGSAAAETYEVLAVSGEGYELVERRIVTAMDREVAAAVRATQARRAMNEALATSSVTVNQAGKDVSGLGNHLYRVNNAMMNASFAVQDFTSVLGSQGLAGGLRAVQNNIPPVLVGMGATAGIAAALSVVAVGIGVVIDNWETLSEAFRSTPIPEVDNSIEGLTRKLQKMNKEIETQRDLYESGKSSATGFFGAFDAWGGDNSGFEKRKLERMEALKAETEELLEQKKLVEGTTFADSDAAREIAGLAKRVIAAAGGGQRAAEAVMDHTGADEDEARRIVAEALRGSVNDLNLVRKSFDVVEREYQKIAPEFVKARKEAEKAAKDVAKRFDDTASNMGKLAEKFREGQEKRAAEIDKAAEKMAAALDKHGEKLDEMLAKLIADNEETPYESLVRDVEYKNFGRVNPRTGRWEGGLGMTSEEVGRAGKIAQEFIEAGGYDPAYSAAMSIQQVYLQNQQAFAARQNQVERWRREMMQQAGNVGTIMDFGY